jgi:hypothetical protein
MRKVGVIDYKCIQTIGESDLKIVDKYYTKVDGDLRWSARLIRAEDAEIVGKLLAEQNAIIKAAEDRLFEITTIFNNILHSGVDSKEYPDIRSKEWFKEVKTKLQP